MSPPSLPPQHSDDVDRVLRRLGYEHARTKGSHKTYTKSGKIKIVTVPQCRELPRGTMKSILNQMEISPEEFLNILNKKN